jgi:uncharacterized membrane protein
MLAIEFYNVVLAIHIMAVVVAFGVIFAYPVLVPWLRRTHPEAMPGFHAAQERVDRMVISPGLVVILAAGIYLASKADVWSKVWVSVPLLILIVLGGLGGAFLTPTERKLSEVARRDLGAGGGALSAEYDALLSRWTTGALTAAVLVLVAIFFMAAKP